MTTRPRLALLLFCLLCWLPGFFTLPPGDRDESRFAQATKQMLETGDYVRISNGSEARNRKPIGIYWLQLPFAAAARAAGITAIWPYRLPSLLGGLLAVLGTFELGLLLARDQRAALLAGAMLAGSLLLSVEVHIAKTDAALLGATVVAIAVLARAYLASVSAAAAAAFWLAIGAGILLKGPVLPMVACLTVLALWIADRRIGWLAGLRPAWGVPLMLLVVLPWFVAIERATHGDFVRQSVGGDLAGKLAGGDDAHGGPPGLHLLLLPLLALPAAIPMLRAFPDAWRDRHDGATRFLLAWLVPSWIVFELVPTKLPHYVLPLYPALCLLGARWLLDPARRTPPRWLRALTNGAFWVACLVLATACLVLPALVGGRWWLGAPASAAVALIAAVVLIQGRRRGVVTAIALMPLITWTAIGLELPSLAPLWLAPRVAAALRADWPGWNPLGRGFGSVGFHEPSLLFLAGTDTRLLPTATTGAAALADGTVTALLVSERDRAAFEQASARLNLAPRRIDEIDGFNYSRGRHVALGLYLR